MERTPGHSAARIHSPFGIGREPVHVAMRAGFEEFAKIVCGVRDRVRTGDGDAVEAERFGLARQRGFQFSAGEFAVQKSRST